MPPHRGMTAAEEPPYLYAVPPPDEPYGDREPPHDDGAERAVLGAAMLSRTALDDAAELLHGPEFHRPPNELIWAAILELRDAGEPVEAYAVAGRLAERGELGRAGGAPYLHTLISEAPAPASAGFYARVILDRYGQRALATAGLKIQQLGYSAAGADLADLQHAATEELRQATSRGAASIASSWQPLDLTGFLDGTNLDSPPPAHLARSDGAQLLYSQAVHAIAGEPESGKSWVALMACAQEVTAGRPALFVDFEDRPARVIARMLALGCSPDAIARLFRYLRPEVALNPASARHLDAAADGAGVAIVDGITEAMTMHGLSLLDNEDVARWLALLPRRIADLGPAVLQVDHVVKNADARGRYALGGQHKLAGIDGAQFKIAVAEPFGRGKRGLARITLDKDREGHVRALATGTTVATLTLDSTASATHEAGTLRAYLDPPSSEIADDGSFRPTGLMERVSRFLEVNPGATQSVVEQTVRGSGPKLRRALRQLVAEDYVRAEPLPGGGAQHYCEEPFRDGPER